MIKSVFVRDNQNRLRFFLYKSIPQGKDTRFMYFKRKVMEALDAAESKLDANKITKAVEDIIACSVLEKTIEAHTNDVHTWSNGRRYKKLPSGRWAPVYDEYTRGAKQAINAIKRKADVCTNSEDLLQLILDNRSRFEDKDGHPYPWVKDLHDYVSKRNDGLESMPDAIKRNVEAYKRIHSEEQKKERAFAEKVYSADDSKGEKKGYARAKREAKKHNAELAESVFDVPDDEFDFPRHNYVLPCLCKKARTLMGLNDTRRVLLKARIMARQSALHSEIRTPLKNKATIYNALYKTGEMVYRDGLNEHYYYAFVKGAGGDYYSCVVDTNPNNDYVEIVDWRVIDEDGYRKMKKQVEKAE